MIPGCCRCLILYFSSSPLTNNILVVQHNYLKGIGVGSPEMASQILLGGWSSPLWPSICLQYGFLLFESLLLSSSLLPWRSTASHSELLSSWLRRLALTMLISFLSISLDLRTSTYDKLRTFPLVGTLLITWVVCLLLALVWATTKGGIWRPEFTRVCSCYMDTGLLGTWLPCANWWFTASHLMWGCNLCGFLHMPGLWSGCSCHSLASQWESWPS